ncbi:hypothetical protein VK70_02940 [Paenibacillus durus ATCC 35681]|uniref:Uncharacterized protein n=1 Tax=Paenibacillus durus ATCC 35681 TaxID=1333534 RepID=A0A0F7F6Z7_PAEDU|nr:hypothetical protein VK70_02940 [Paenibacillus durus ATCC 35681]
MFITYYFKFWLIQCVHDRKLRYLDILKNFRGDVNQSKDEFKAEVNEGKNRDYRPVIKVYRNAMAMNAKTAVFFDLIMSNYI